MKRGFTLIELLAVIVILAVIVLIAIPVVLDVIDKSQEKTMLIGAKRYIDAVNQAILISGLDDNRVNDGVYKILENGNICLEYDSDNKCIKELKVESQGDKPPSGEITIKDQEVEDVILNLNDKTIMKDENGELAHFKPKYEIGEEVIFNPGDGERAWNVIDEGVNTVTLMLTENLGETVAWYAADIDNSYGPKDALEYLNTLTAGWNNVEPIKNYSYINNLNGTEKPYGYQKIEIKDGKTTLTHKDGSIITEVSGISKARLLTIEEVFEIAQKTNVNLKEENLRAYIERNITAINGALQSEGYEKSATTVDEVIDFVIFEMYVDGMDLESRYIQTYYTVMYMVDEYEIESTYDIMLPKYLYQNIHQYAPCGYWTLSSFAVYSTIARYVNYNGDVNGDIVGKGDFYGVRPVITVLKSSVFK